jgi:hypothetical protein
MKHEEALTDNKSLSGEMDGNGYTHPVKKRQFKSTV